MKRAAIGLFYAALFLLCLSINKQIIEAWIVDYIPFYATLLCIPFFIIMAESLVRIYDNLFGEVKK